MGLVLVSDGSGDDAKGWNVLDKGRSLGVVVKGIQDPHAHMEGADPLVDEKELTLHIQDLGVGDALDPVFGGIVDEVAYLLDGAAGLAHGGNKEKRADLRGRVVVIAVLRINLRDYDPRFIIVPQGISCSAAELGKLPNA